MMMKSLLCAILVAELGCWSTSEPAPTKPESSAAVTARGPETCTEAGERVLLRTCRERDSLAWTITNRMDVPIWAFVAPQGTKSPTLSRDNVAVRADRGQVVLSKLRRPPIGGEQVPIGAVLLAPGESDRGSVPVGTRVNQGAANITGAQVSGTTWVLSVALEVGFAEVRPIDRAIPTKPPPLVVVINVEPSRQEIVRTPAVPWR